MTLAQLTRALGFPSPLQTAPGVGLSSPGPEPHRRWGCTPAGRRAEWDPGRGLSPQGPATKGRSSAHGPHTALPPAAPNSGPREPEPLLWFQEESSPRVPGNPEVPLTAGGS